MNPLRGRPHQRRQPRTRAEWNADRDVPRAERERLEAEQDQEPDEDGIYPDDVRF